jgi:hypothetical protein
MRLSPKTPGQPKFDENYNSDDPSTLNRKLDEILMRRPRKELGDFNQSMPDANQQDVTTTSLGLMEQRKKRRSPTQYPEVSVKLNAS